MPMNPPRNGQHQSSGAAAKVRRDGTRDSEHSLRPLVMVNGFALRSTDPRNALTFNLFLFKLPFIREFESVIDAATMQLLYLSDK